MLTLSQFQTRQVASAFAAGVLFTVLLAFATTALAQSPTPVPVPPQQMIEWCRQMMGQMGTMMQGMMSGMCMGR
jgi:hypothetical protein